MDRNQFLLNFQCFMGGGGFSKNFENFIDLFLGRPNWFSELSNHYKDTILTKFFAPQAKFWEKKSGQKSRFYVIFGKIWPKKVCDFSARASPSKLAYIGAFRKILGSVTKNGYHPFGSAGGRTPEAGKGHPPLCPPPPPPKPTGAFHYKNLVMLTYNALNFNYNFNKPKINNKESRLLSKWHRNFRP